MSHFALQSRMDGQVDARSAVSIREALLRAVAELSMVRDGVERAFDEAHAHASDEARRSADYIVKLQSVDTLTQQIAAIERFLANISAEFGDSEMISARRAAANITLAAVAARLIAAPFSVDHQPGDCDLF